MDSLWNLIRDWFVQYIWGGYTSNNVEYFNFNFGSISFVGENGSTMYGNISTSYFYFPIGDAFVEDGASFDANATYYINLGDWLSTTSTIIVLILLLIAFGFMVVGIFRLFSRMFSLRS